MQQLSDNLFIADAQSVRRLSSDHDFDEIVTLGYRQTPNRTPPAESTTKDSFVFPDGQHDFYDFKAAADYVLTTILREDTCLVHCLAGISRSPGVCAVVLAESTEMSLAEALEHIRNERPIANPAPEIRESMELYTDQKVIPAPQNKNDNQILFFPSHRLNPKY